MKKQVLKIAKIHTTNVPIVLQWYYEGLTSDTRWSTKNGGLIPRVVVQSKGAIGQAVERAIGRAVERSTAPTIQRAIAQSIERTCVRTSEAVDGDLVSV